MMHILGEEWIKTEKDYEEYLKRKNANVGVIYYPPSNRLQYDKDNRSTCREDKDRIQD